MNQHGDMGGDVGQCGPKYGGEFVVTGVVGWCGRIGWGLRGGGEVEELGWVIVVGVREYEVAPALYVGGDASQCSPKYGN